jgi:hypothetical protein
VLETLGPWCLHDKKLVIPPRVARTPETQDAVLQSFDDEEAYLKSYISREPINTLEKLNDRIYEALATVIRNMLRLAREN